MGDFEIEKSALCGIMESKTSTHIVNGEKIDKCCITVNVKLLGL